MYSVIINMLNIFTTKFS